MREHQGVGFDLGRALASLLHPVGGDWLWLGGVAAVGLLSGLFTAAAIAARHGAGEGLAGDDDGS